MTDDKKLIERLRNAAWGGLVDFPICDEAADTIARLEAERDAARSTLDDMLMVRHCSPMADGESVSSAVDRIIDWEAMVNLDPAVSSAAAELRATARLQAMEECARMLDAEHERSKRLHNYAACYARAIRAAMQGK